jgi:hypothetical protein
VSAVCFSSAFRQRFDASSKWIFLGVVTTAAGNRQPAKPENFFARFAT